MTVSLRPLEPSDAEAHQAGEDDLTVRWLTGGRGTVEDTRAWIEGIRAAASAGSGKRIFGVWLDEDPGGPRLAGFVDWNPDVDDGLRPGDVNLSYAVHPWARGRGLAVTAVGLVCDLLRERQVGRRAALRVEPENQASVRVAEKAGFRLDGEFVSGLDTGPDGQPVTLRRYVLDL